MLCEFSICHQDDTDWYSMPRFPKYRARIFATAPLRGEGLERISAMSRLTHEPWTQADPFHIYKPDALAEKICDVGAEVLICEMDKVAGSVLECGLRAIFSTRGEPTNVDIAAATAQGIPVMRAPGRNADGVAEVTIGLILAAARHIVTADRDVHAGELFKDGKIPYQRFRAWELNGRTAGIIGLGAVGRAVRWRLEGLGMKTLAFDPFNPEATDSLEQVIAGSDVITMHAPVTEETTGFIGAEQFAAMRDGVVYINAARADLHDSDALGAALNSGKVAAAALDHVEGEFLPLGHPLLGISNLIITPHIGGATYDTEERQSTMVADDLELIIAGKPPKYIVNPEVL